MSTYPWLLWRSESIFELVSSVLWSVYQSLYHGMEPSKRRKKLKAGIIQGHKGRHRLGEQWSGCDSAELQREQDRHTPEEVKQMVNFKRRGWISITCDWFWISSKSLLKCSPSLPSIWLQNIEWRSCLAVLCEPGSVRDQGVDHTFN